MRLDASSIQDAVPDDLLRLILLRLDSPTWLMRAACVCKRWRRAITDDDDQGRGFLRLASWIHVPVVAGHYQNNIIGGGRRFVPSSSAAPIDGTRFSLDFIPHDLVTSGPTPIKNWEVADCHGGLVLLHERHYPLSDLVVCDPLTRQCRRIHYPPVAGAAAFSVFYSANLFLIDGEDDDDSTSISNFRVLCRTNGINGSELYIFSMADGGGVGIGHWRFVRRSEHHHDRYRAGCGHVAGRVDGSLYLGVRTCIVTVFDMAKLEFCKVDLPPSHVQRSSFLPQDIRPCSTFAVVHGGGSGGGPDPALPSPPAVFIVHVHRDLLELFHRKVVVHGDNNGSDEWVLQHSIPRLSSATRGLPGCPDPKRFSWQMAEVIAGGTGLAILSAWISESSDRRVGMSFWLFSFNVDTMELQAVTNNQADDYHGMTVASTYTLPWPRFLRAGPC